MKDQISEEVRLYEHPPVTNLPGFIDTHLHYPQTEMIAAYGEQLLEWLETYTFPTERKFADPDYALRITKISLDELTVLAQQLPSSSVRWRPSFYRCCFFTEAKNRNLRMIAGINMMDRNCPEYSQDTPESSYQESKRLIKKWHDNGRLRYAITPRFSPTSSKEQLQKAGQLLREHPDVYLHTHLSENKNEIEWVKSLFPDCKNYLDTYDQANLLGRRSIFAHCIHLEEEEWQRLRETSSGIASSSNLQSLWALVCFLSRAVKEDINVGMGTDVGAGTSFSILQTLNEAYKVLHITRRKTISFQRTIFGNIGRSKNT